MIEKNLNKIIPILSNSYIISENCVDDGTLEIGSYINSKVENNIIFYLELENPKINIRCKLPSTEANSNIVIQCKTLSKINNEKIKIDSKIIYDIDSNELFYINNDIESNVYITCKDNMALKKEEAQKKLNANFSFRQASKFKKQNNKYTFFLATFIKENIDANAKLIMTVEIKSESNEKNSNFLNKRKLSRREPQTVECTIQTQTNLNENGVGSAGWDCITGESSIDDATGLDIKESDDISGIPEDPELIDPAQTDELISSGEMKDYSIEENLNELLPIFNTLNLNYSLCKNDGSLKFKGNSTSTIKEDVAFNLTLSYPESIFACRLPRTLKGEIIEIECFNREYFENSTIIVEETVIRDGYNEFFILRNISSGEEFVTCSSSQNEIKTQEYENDFGTISRIMKKNSSNNGGGLGLGGIIAISIIGVAVVAGVILLYTFILKKNEKVNSDKNDNSINSTKKTFSSSSSYY